MQKVKSIELLRIIGCLAIVLLHLFKPDFLDFDCSLFKHFMLITKNSQKAVDLFFILSGLFFAYKLDTTKSFCSFIVNKLIRLWPILIACIVISAIISAFDVYKFNLYSNLLVLFNFLSTPLDINLAGVWVRPFWYVSAMIWVLSIYYYLLKNFNKKHVQFFIAIAIIVSYFLLISMHDGKINNGCVTVAYIFTGKLLRAFGGLGVGYFIGEWWKNHQIELNKIKLNLKQTFLITIVEAICLFFMIQNLLLHDFRFRNDMIFIIDFTVLIILFVSQKGYISRIIDNTILGDISVIFARYTYSIYMIHTIIFRTFRELWWDNCQTFVVQHSVFVIVVSLLSSFVAGVLLYHLVEYPCFTYFKKKINDINAKTSATNQVS